MTDIFENGREEIKMLDFMKNLYKKYKVLNQLSDRESNKFQSQIVSLLVDQEENVDLHLLEQIISEKGLEAFLIQVLGNILERPLSKMQANSDLNLQALKKEQNQLQKKSKLLQRKQQRLKSTEEQLLSTCKQKILLFQAQAMKRITAKQGQVKKQITNLLNQLKSKEKVLLQKLQIVKTNKIASKLLEQKEKNLFQRSKALQKRQKQVKSKDDSQLILKKEAQIQEFNEIINKLKENLKQLNTKYKNIELAYRKVKGDNQKLMNERQILIKEKDSIKSEQKVSKKLQLDNLEISFITPEIVHKGFPRETIERLFLIPKLMSNQRQKVQVKAVLQELFKEQGTFIEQKQHEPHQNAQQNLSFFKLQEFNQNPHQQLLKEIQSLDLDHLKDKQFLFRNKLLEKWIQKASQLRYPLEVCNKLLQFMLQLLQKGANSKVVQCYSNENVINHLQKVYLCHESNEQIAQSTTLLLSRIKLWKNEINLFQNFRKAIEIRKLLQAQNSLLFMNIKYLM